MLNLQAWIQQVSANLLNLFVKAVSWCSKIQFFLDLMLILFENLWFYNESCGLCVDIPPVWCGCLAHVVRVLSTNGADGMHYMCEGLTLLLYMEG